MKALSQNDIQTARSFLTQLVDVIQEEKNKMAKFRARSKTGKNRQRWKKGQSSSSNPSKSRHRDAAKANRHHAARILFLQALRGVSRAIEAQVEPSDFSFVSWNFYGYRSDGIRVEVGPNVHGIQEEVHPYQVVTSILPVVVVEDAIGI